MTRHEDYDDDSTMVVEEKLKERIKELEAENELLNKELDEGTEIIREGMLRRKYLQGMIDGLKFSIRCNGVSGGEVE